MREWSGFSTAWGRPARSSLEVDGIAAGSKFRRSGSDAKPGGKLVHILARGSARGARGGMHAAKRPKRKVIMASGDGTASRDGRPAKGV